MDLEFGHLVCIESGITIPLVKARCVVGRAADCDIVLPNRKVSSKHCLLEYRDGAWFVTDLASSNGIRINAARCSAGPLPHNSILSVADVRLEVRCQSPRPMPAAAAAPLCEPEALPDVELDSDISQLSATQLPVDFIIQPVRAPLPPRSSLGKLVPLDGGDVIPLRLARILIGRSPSCNIVLQHSDVSGKHCQLEFHGGQWHVRDLGSRNGIFVNDEPETAAPLKPNSVLSVAKHRFKIEYEAPASESKLVEDSAATVDLEAVAQADCAKSDTFADGDFSFGVP